MWTCFGAGLEPVPPGPVYFGLAGAEVQFAGLAAKKPTWISKSPKRWVLVLEIRASNPRCLETQVPDPQVLGSQVFVEEWAVLAT